MWSRKGNPVAMFPRAPRLTTDASATMAPLSARPVPSGHASDDEGAAAAAAAAATTGRRTEAEAEEEKDLGARTLLLLLDPVVGRLEAPAPRAATTS